MQSTSSLLIVDHIDIDPAHPHVVSGEIILGGRRETVVLDLSEPTLTAYKRMPWELESIRAAQRAVIDLLLQRHRGDAPTLPADLSDVVRQTSEAWPARAPPLTERPAFEAAAAAVTMTRTRFEHALPESGFVTAHMNFCGTPTVVVIDCRGGEQRALRFRFAEGVHPWQLAPVEQYALLVALLRFRCSAEADV